jgi:hypothetical protein
VAGKNFLNTCNADSGSRRGLLPEFQNSLFSTSVPIFPVLKVLHALEVKMHVEPVQV